MARHGGRAGITGASLVCHERLQLSNVCAYFKSLGFSLLLDDHGMFQSMRVVKRIQLGLFGIRRGSRRREGRIHNGDDICFKCSLPMHAPQHKSPFSMYFVPSKVSRLSMVKILLIVMSFTFFSTAGVTRLVQRFGSLLERA